MSIIYSTRTKVNNTASATGSDSSVAIAALQQNITALQGADANISSQLTLLQSAQLSPDTAIQGNVTGTLGNCVVATVGSSTASDVSAATVLANLASSDGNSGAIVRRDINGGFLATNVILVNTSLQGTVTSPALSNITNTLGSQINTLDSKVVANTDNIASHSTAIATNTTNITANTAELNSIQTSLGNIVGGQNNQDTLISNNLTSINNLVSEQANQTAIIDAHTTKISDNTNAIATNTSNIAALQGGTTPSDATASNVPFKIVQRDSNGGFAAGNVNLISAVISGSLTAPEIANLQTGVGANTTELAAHLTRLDSLTTTNDDQQLALTAVKANVLANTTDIATNTSAISTNTAGIAVNASAISTNTTNIAANTSAISTNTTNIAANTTSISTNTTNIAANTSAISTNADNIGANIAAISAHTSDILTHTNDIAANTASITTNTTNIAANTSAISTNTAGITANTTAIATHTTNIAANTSAISTNTSAIATHTTNIAANTSAISTNTTNIAANTSAISTHTTNIAANTSAISTHTTNIAANTSAISTNTASIASNTSGIAANAANTATNTTGIANNLASINALSGVNNKEWKGKWNSATNYLIGNQVTKGAPVDDVTLTLYADVMPIMPGTNPSPNLFSLGTQVLFTSQVTITHFRIYIPTDTSSGGVYNLRLFRGATTTVDASAPLYTSTQTGWNNIPLSSPFTPTLNQMYTIAYTKPLNYAFPGRPAGLDTSYQEKNPDASIVVIQNSAYQVDYDGNPSQSGVVTDGDIFWNDIVFTIPGSGSPVTTVYQALADNVGIDPETDAAKWQKQITGFNDLGVGYNALQTNVTSLQTNTTTLQTNVSSLQTNVSSLQTNVSSLQTSDPIAAEYSAYFASGTDQTIADSASNSTIPFAFTRVSGAITNASTSSFTITNKARYKFSIDLPFTSNAPISLQILNNGVLSILDTVSRQLGGTNNYCLTANATVELAAGSIITFGITSLKSGGTVDIVWASQNVTNAALSTYNLHASMICERISNAVF